MANLQPGRTLGSYVVERELGRGGMGIVVLARQTSLDRPAVLKRVRADLALLPELSERFEREARAAAALHHENIVAVYDCFVHRGDQYIAQEYVAGVDLHRALSHAGRLPPRIAGLIALGTLRGLEEIHARGTVHRDLTPRNLLLGQRGEVKIADFGLALPAQGSGLTQPGVALGSPPYMSPEQMTGERVDARTDLFALGVILYEMLTGRTPYPEPAADEEEPIVGRMLRDRYPRLRSLAAGTPRWLARATQRCLRGRAKRRCASAAELRRTFEEHLGHPSPADTRAELAAWLWDHQIHEARDGETVVLVAATPNTKRRFASARGVAIALCLLVFGALLVNARPSPGPDNRPRSEAAERWLDTAASRVAAASGSGWDWRLTPWRIANAGSGQERRP